MVYDELVQSGKAVHHYVVGGGQSQHTGQICVCVRV